MNIINSLSEKMIDRVGMGSLIALAIIVSIAFLVGGYYIKREINYYFGYESSVKETSEQVVCGMIKPEKYEEFLIDPKVCRK